VTIASERMAKIGSLKIGSRQFTLAQFSGQIGREYTVFYFSSERPRAISRQRSGQLLLDCAGPLEATTRASKHCPPNRKKIHASMAIESMVFRRYQRSN
jgi:hypothetical protein